MFASKLGRIYAFMKVIKIMTLLYFHKNRYLYLITIYKIKEIKLWGKLYTPLFFLMHFQLVNNMGGGELVPVISDQ